MPIANLPSLSSTLRLEATVFFRAALASPWGLALNPTSDLRFHFATQGDCWLGSTDVPAPIHLQPGDIVLVTGGGQSWVADQPGRPLIPSEALVNSCQASQPLFQTADATHRLICGQARIHDQGGGWLLLLLPPILHLRSADKGDRIWKIVEAIGATSRPLEEDDTHVLDRLAEALFLSLLRRATDLELETGGLANAFREPAMRRVLDLIHTRFDESWTTQALAAEGLTSRATLARRFKSTLGCSIMGYLGRVRMSNASRMLLDGVDVNVIAHRVGYESTEAFRKAFKRQVGVTPARFHRDRGARFTAM